MEPLGESQVAAYLKLLSRQHRITVVSFEKREDFADKAAVARQRRALDHFGIRWIPHLYHQRPRALATAWDMSLMFLTAIRASGDTDLIHARSLIATAVARAVSGLRRIPFIFDMRGLLADEMVMAKRLRQESLTYRLFKRSEAASLRRAGAIVSLTEAAIPYIRNRIGEGGERARIAVIATCADLDHFTFIDRPRSDRLTTVGSLGTLLSGWFRLDMLCAFLRVAANRFPDLRISIVTREDEDLVRNAIRSLGGPADRVSIFGVPYARSPEVMAELDLLALFFEGGLAKIGSSPTRMGEALACGLPVIANAGMGDVETIVRRRRVGVIVEAATDEAMEKAIDELIALLQDPDLPRRCRQTAELCFSASRGAEIYDELYRAVVADRHSGNSKR